MVQQSCGSGFLEKASPLIIIDGNMGREEFERDVSVELGVLGFVDYSHASLTKFVEYLIMRNGLADHSYTFEYTACPTLLFIDGVPSSVLNPTRKYEYFANWARD
jgi:hypothetical protein